MAFFILNLNVDDIAIPKRGLRQTLRIVHRFHFSSALKRMSVICSMQTPQSSTTSYIVTTKGAPETLKHMVRFFVIVNINYMLKLCYSLTIVPFFL